MPPSTSSNRPKHQRTRTSSSTHSARSSQQLPKTEITINIYDLLPPGRLSSLLWTIGGSLLHSGVVINGREYAYGGHNRRNTTGVYWTKAGIEPPGSTFRCSVLQGFSLHSPADLEAVLRDVSARFLGTRYNLLTCNCNHFTSVLCQRLTGRSAPAWLNRAASIGVALPCVVPREWIAPPPDVETAEGELLEEEDEDEDEDEEEDGLAGEQEGMMESDRRRREREERRRKRESRGEAGSYQVDGERCWFGGKSIVTRAETPPPRVVALRDNSGRELPVAERAPLPRKT